MTLLDILPSLRSFAPPRLDPTLWPVDTHYDDWGRVTVDGTALEDVADRFGTPTTAGDIALFRVDFVEPEVDGHTFVWVDAGPVDGLSSNVVLANRHSCGPQVRATVLGRSGRDIALGAQLPFDVHAGEVIAIPHVNISVGGALSRTGSD